MEFEDIGEIEDEVIICVGVFYIWKISEIVMFDEEFSSEIGEEKMVIKLFICLKLKINGSFYVMFVYEIECIFEVLLDKKNFDCKILVGLNYFF